jgi:hypothetical protein
MPRFWSFVFLGVEIHLQKFTLDNQMGVLGKMGNFFPVALAAGVGNGAGQRRGWVAGLFGGVFGGGFRLFEDELGGVLGEVAAESPPNFVSPSPHDNISDSFEVRRDRLEKDGLKHDRLISSTEVAMTFEQKKSTQEARGSLRQVQWPKS